MRSRRHLQSVLCLLASATLSVPTAAQEAVAPKETTFATSQSKTWIPKLRLGTDESYIEVYGQINKGLLVSDDGGSTLGYIPVDNANSSTRGGVRIYAELNEFWSIWGNVEAEWNPYSTANVNQLNRGDYDWDTGLLRKAEVYTASEEFGTLWLGQGSMASDSTAEVDLSGTTVVGYSSISDLAGGQFFRLAGGTLSEVQVKDAFTNFDGLQRKLRVRYDTPKFAGFSLGSSVGTQVVPTKTESWVWDVAAKYENTVGDFKVAGAVAFSRPSEDDDLYDGSVSVLHEPTGLSITLAAAYSVEELVDSRYFYTKLGYQADYFEVGKTAMSVDAYFGEDIKGSDSNSSSFGIQLVQNLDYYQTELYLGARSYDFDDAVEEVDTGVAFLAGARVKF